MGKQTKEHVDETERIRRALSEPRSASRKKKRIRRRIWALAMAAVFLLAAIVVDRFVFPLPYVWALTERPEISERQAGEMRIHFLDAGQGDCTVIEFPDGRTMMIDGGDGKESGTRKILGYCFALGIEEFDYILLTHTDSDHAGGLDDVLRCFGAKKVFVPYTEDENVNTAYASFAEVLKDTGADTEISHTLRTIVSEDIDCFYYGMWLSPFSPEIDDSFYNGQDGVPESETINDTSAVVYFEYAGRRLLLTGDASERVEDKIIDDFKATDGVVFELETETDSGRITLAPRLENLDFLKAGHHGSSSSTGEKLAEYCKPAEIFISCGAGNTYGHPNLTPIENLEGAFPEAEFYRTDEMGNILLTIGCDGSYAITSVG